MGGGGGGLIEDLRYLKRVISIIRILTLYRLNRVVLLIGRCKFLTQHDQSEALLRFR